MLLGESLPEAARLGVDDEVDVTLPVQRDVLAAMTRDGGEAHAFEQRAQQLRVGRRVLDELESVRAHRVVEKIGHRPSGGELVSIETVGPAF